MAGWSVWVWTMAVMGRGCICATWVCPSRLCVGRGFDFLSSHTPPIFMVRIENCGELVFFCLHGRTVSLSCKFLLRIRENSWSGSRRLVCAIMPRIDPHRQCFVCFCLLGPFSSTYKLSVVNHKSTRKLVGVTTLGPRIALLLLHPSYRIQTGKQGISFEANWPSDLWAAL